MSSQVFFALGLRSPFPDTCYPYFRCLAFVAGSVEFVLSGVLFVQIIIDLFTQKEKQDFRHFGVLALHLADFEEWAATRSDSTWLCTEMAIGLFTILYAVCAGYLTLGTVRRDKNLAVPWIVADAFSTIVQGVGLHLRKERTRMKERDEVLSICNMVICIALWLVVVFTRRTWIIRRSPAGSVAYSRVQPDEEASATTPLLSSSTGGVGEHQSLCQQAEVLTCTAVRALPTVEEELPSEVHLEEVDQPTASPAAAAQESPEPGPSNEPPSAMLAPSNPHPPSLQEIEQEDAVNAAPSPWRTIAGNGDVYEGK